MGLPQTMAAVLLTGHGGFDKLEYRLDVPVPTPQPHEVLIRIAAAGVNNTDINTRIGWYSKRVTSATNVGGEAGFALANSTDGGWTGEPLQFPRIQGADACGHIVAVGAAVDPARLGERVIVAPMMSAPVGHKPFACWTFGSEGDGSFAQYAVAPAVETYKVECNWSDAELASIPCAYSAAENALQRAGVKAGERVLITGASGGVGSAAVQLARRRGAEVIAVAGAAKAAGVQALGADQIIPRDQNLVEALGPETVDVVFDVVAGPAWPQLLEVLRRGGRYATVGAIAGPLVELDVRTLYLKDLTFFGCTYQAPGLFESLVGYIERDEIRPIVAATYPLREIVRAQQDFLAKKFIGKLVLIPPED